MSTTTAKFRALEASERLPEAYVNVYYLDDLKRRVSVARVDGKLYAFDDLCPHEACPLSSGLLTGTTLMCQCHGSKFDVTTGELLRGPATAPLVTYEARDHDGQIEVRV